MKTIRWGMIGCGDVAEVKSGPGFQNAAGSELVAVMRRRGDLAADFARRHGVRASYDDAAALINDPAVDAVYVATPPGAHEELALAVCAARKPAYIEKPMARTHAECQRMIDAFSAAGVPLFVAYYRRALPRFLRARELVASGALGRVTGVSYRLAGPYHRDIEALVREGAALPWRVQAEHAGGGLFLDLGCHTLDMLDFILGPLEDVQGSASNVATAHLTQNPQRVPNLPRSAPAGDPPTPDAKAQNAQRVPNLPRSAPGGHPPTPDAKAQSPQRVPNLPRSAPGGDPPTPDAILVEDGVAMTFRTAGGALGAAQWTFASDERADEIVISGDRGELRLSTFGNEPVALRRGGQVESFDLPNPRHVQQPMIQTVVDHLLGRGRCESMGVSAARTSAVIDIVLRSYYGTRDDGFWRFPESWPGRHAKATRPPG